MSLGPAEYRRLIGRFATGVAVVAVRDVQGAVQGMTVNSLTSVSLEPPQLLVCLTRGTRTADAIGRGDRPFVVNLLAQSQKGVSAAFARPGEDRGVTARFVERDDDLPVLAGTIGHLVCEVAEIHDGADHVIVLGRVAGGGSGGGDPLLFFEGRYARHIGFEDYPVPNWWS